MQEVAQILLDALPEYKFKAHKEEEKKQYCDNSKVIDPVLAASVRSSACKFAACSADHLNSLKSAQRGLGQAVPDIRTNLASAVMQTIQELGMTLTPPEVFLPAMVRCMIRLGLAKPVEQ